MAHTTVKARFWPWLSGKNLRTFRGVPSSPGIGSTGGSAKDFLGTSSSSLLLSSLDLSDTQVYAPYLLGAGEGSHNPLPNLALSCRENTHGQIRIREQLLQRNVQRFRGGLVFKAHRLCVLLISRLESKKEEDEEDADSTPENLCLNTLNIAGSGLSCASPALPTPHTASLHPVTC